MMVRSRRRRVRVTPTRSRRRMKWALLQRRLGLRWSRVGIILRGTLLGVSFLIMVLSVEIWDPPLWHHLKDTLHERLRPLTTWFEEPGHWATWLNRWIQSPERAARLEHENDVLREQVGYLRRLVVDKALREETTSTGEAVRVHGYRGRPFVKSLVLDQGQHEGIMPGQPVETDQGLVGQVIQSTPHQSIVLLFTDEASRIPARLVDQDLSLLVAGTHKGLPRLLYLDEQKIDPKKFEGTYVVTSGEGGIFRPGTVMGSVVRQDGAWRLLPAAPLERLTFVRVIKDELSQ